MAKQAIFGEPRVQRGWTVFAIMALVVIAVIAAGFGPSYAASLGAPGLPFWVHLHGAVMTTWVLLFALQTALVRRRSLALHRALGFTSIGLVVVMVPLAIATDLLAIQRDAVPPFFTPAMMFAADLSDIVVFAVLFGWAVALRRRRDWHARLLLCATVVLTWPALGRLAPLHRFGLAMIVPLATAVLIALALVGPLNDLVRRGRVHPAYLWGVGLITLAQVLHGPIAASAPVRAIVAAVTP